MLPPGEGCQGREGGREAMPNIKISNAVIKYQIPNA
jgi:hypothetical protein